MLFEPQYRHDNKAARVAMTLFRLTQAIKKMTQSESDQAGLSPAQIQGLLFIYHTRSDVASVGNFADMIGSSHVTAVKIINGLMEKEFVQKDKHPSDKRITLLQLTEKGLVMVLRLQDWGSSLEEAVSQMSDEVLDHLELGLGSLASTLQKNGHLIVSEPCLGCMHFQPNCGDGNEPHYCNLIKKYLAHEATLKECPEHTPKLRGE